MSVFLKRNDVGDVVSFTCEHEDGTPVDLTGATVKFNMGKKNKLITSGTAVITNPTVGAVEYTLVDKDTLVAGNFPAEFEVTFSNGRIKTFPTIGYLMVNIEANLDLGKTSLVEDSIAMRVTAIEQFKTDLTNQVNADITALDSKINTSIANIDNQKANKSDTYTKAELAPYLQGGDTSVVEEVFTIVSSNNGNGTFTYQDSGNNNITGELLPDGSQVFTFQDGTYTLGSNRVECIVGDTLRRSVKSGGLQEISETKIALTIPEGATREITFRYFQRVGVTGEANLFVSDVKPPYSTNDTVWMKVIG